MVTAEEVRQSVLATNGTTFVVRECSLCGYPLSYRVINGEPYFDRGCDCTSKHNNLEPVDWGDLAELINIQTNDKSRNEYRILFGLPGEVPDPNEQAPQEDHQNG